MKKAPATTGLKLTLTVCALLIAYSLLTLPRHPTVPVISSPTPSVSPVTFLSIRSKTAGCLITGSLPDKECTPGQGIPGVTKEQVCAKGYSSSVRSVSESVKNAVYAEYGITSHATGEYEVDHFVSLEIGGSNDISNLWPEPASPAPGFHEKDVVENWLHARVCDGSLSLAQAQQQEVTDWVSIYQSIQGTK